MWPQATLTLRSLLHFLSSGVAGRGYLLGSVPFFLFQEKVAPGVGAQL